MRWLARLLGRAAQTLVVLASIQCGCGPRTPSGADAGRAGGDAGAPGEHPDAGGLVTVTGIVRSSNFAPVAGAMVTVVNGAPPRSATSGSDGRFELMLPPATIVFLRADANGLMPVVTGIVVTTSTELARLDTLPAQELEGGAAALGITLDPAKGMVYVHFHGAQSAGYTAALSTPHGTPVTLAPGADGGAPTPVFSETTLSQEHRFLIFPNAEVGATRVTLRALGGGHSCAPDEQVDLWLVMPGVLTHYHASCD